MKFSISKTHFREVIIDDEDEATPVEIMAEINILEANNRALIEAMQGMISHLESYDWDNPKEYHHDETNANIKNMESDIAKAEGGQE